MLTTVKRIIYKLILKRNNLKNESQFCVRSPKGQFVINTTKNHPLKQYLKTIKLYDRFLPILVKNSGSGMIDIGSNIGDTMVLVKSISDVDIVCVEPDQKFTVMLRKNLEENGILGVNIYPFPISNISNYVLIEKHNLNSTGNLIETDSKVGSLKTKTLSNLFEDLNLDINNYRTIKIDTDGFDWDVLNSISEYCKKENKLFDFIFYEHQTKLHNKNVDDPNQLELEIKYLDSLKQIEKLGYNNFFLFDNFGTFVLKTKELSILKSIIEYVRRTTTENNKHSLYFCDVLICKDQSVDIVENSLKEYLHSGIEVV